MKADRAEQLNVFIRYKKYTSAHPETTTCRRVSTWYSALRVQCDTSLIAESLFHQICNMQATICNMSFPLAYFGMFQESNLREHVMALQV